VTEDSMTWDLMEFCETGHDVGCDGTIREISKEKVLYDKAKNQLSVKSENK
jgi:hypothetical protein